MANFSDLMTNANHGRLNQNDIDDFDMEYIQ